MQIIDRKEFVIVALDLSKETFIIHVVFLSLSLKMLIYLAQKVQIALLIVKKVIVLAKYSDFVDVFLKSAIKLPKHFNIKKKLIDLELSK